MAVFRTGTVQGHLTSTVGLVRFAVLLDGGEIEAVGFPSMLGPVRTGDRVIVNTTGIELNLGTGGDGFILWNLDGDGYVEAGPGHIMKLRYTPWQTEVLAAEAPESEHHDILSAEERIDGVPVVVCGLHSQVGAAAAGVKTAAPGAKVGYLMSDGASLPLAWSDNVALLKEAGLVDVTCTYGHAFGGDLEAVNVFSGLVAMVHAGKVDAVIAAMGPGVVGTGSPLGFTAIEQGQILDAATSLGGSAIAALRISFADERTRHLGVSHHTLTALRVAARERCTVVVPVLPEERSRQIHDQLRTAGIGERHSLEVEDGGPALRSLAGRGIRPTSMGRDLDEIPELFVSAAAAGTHAGRLLQDTLGR